jgi:hypothetical protein
MSITPNKIMPLHQRKYSLNEGVGDNEMIMEEKFEEDED